MNALLRVVLHPRRFEVQPLDVRRPPHADQDRVRPHLRTLPREEQHLVGPLLLRSRDLTAEGKADAVVNHRPADDLRGGGVLARQELRLLAQQCDLRTQAGERLRQLAADRPGANDRQPARQLRQ